MCLSTFSILYAPCVLCCPQKPEERFLSPQTGVTNGCGGGGTMWGLGIEPWSSTIAAYISDH